MSKGCAKGLGPMVVEKEITKSELDMIYEDFKKQKNKLEIKGWHQLVYRKDIESGCKKSRSGGAAL